MTLDHSNMTYDLSLLEEGQKIINRFLELAEYEEFNNPEDDDLLKWVIYLCDIGSPYLKQHRNFFKRAKFVQKELNIKNDLLTSFIDGTLQLNPQDDWFRIKVNAMIYKYFIIMDEGTYTTWLSLFLSFHEMQMFTQISLDYTDKDYERKFKTKEEVSRRLPDKQKQLADYERIVFADTTIKQIVTKQVAKVISWPEKMALEILDGPGSE